MKRFAILISTKNRREDLKFTLETLRPFADRAEVVVSDDGSNDGTSEMVRAEFPFVELRSYNESSGYLKRRNQMLDATSAQYAISLDDDADFLSLDPMPMIENHFNEHPLCGAIAFRIFWGMESPEAPNREKAQPVKGFVGCGHAWRVDSWQKIRNYPEWYRFYGEETFASMELVRHGMSVWYLPNILVRHRVDMKQRAQADDFAVRYRNSLRADLFNYLQFYPKQEVLKTVAYVLWMQFRSKILKGNFRVVVPVMMAFADVFRNWADIKNNRLPFSKAQFESYRSLAPAKIFWRPKNSL